MPQEFANRKIIHIDMDCFFAAIEEREHPELKGKPLAVGGSADKRGVLATCNYEARRYGLHSAMPTRTAVQRCPELVLQSVNMPLYKEVSEEIFDIFHRYTELIEPLSLDEAYLDVSGMGSATLIAQDIRTTIRKEQRLTASAGIAPNKFLAKVASDWNKPDGQFVITPNDIDDFIQKLPVKRIHGVGKVTATKLQAMGINLCGELQAYSREQLEDRFGRFGQQLFEYARGIDHRQVKTHRVRKSLSVETTFEQDLPGLDHCLEALPSLLEKLQHRLGRLGSEQKEKIQALFIKIKFNNFDLTTVQAPSNNLNLDLARALMKKGWMREQRPVRLLGIGVHFGHQGPVQDQLNLPLNTH
jgi:DNA polymerase-4